MTSILFLTGAIYCNIFRCLYIKNEKNFLNFILHYIYLDTIFNIFKKKMNLIDDVFLNLRTLKYVVTLMSKKFHFRRPFEKWASNWIETLLKSERQ